MAFTYPNGGGATIWRDDELGSPHNVLKSEVRDYHSAVEGFLDGLDDSVASLGNVSVVTSSFALADTDSLVRFVATSTLTVTAVAATVGADFVADITAATGAVVTINDGTSDIVTLYGGDSATIISDGTGLYIDERRAVRDGTWTPSLTDTAGNPAGLFLASGTYHRSGPKVDVDFVGVLIDVTGVTTGNTVRITNLPFTPRSGNYYGLFRGSDITGLSTPYSLLVGAQGYVTIDKTSIATQDLVVFDDMNVGSAVFQGTMSYLTDVS